ncbi:uncharacterized protein ARMOST_08527 [Armillaria ostoyae]|uniref:Uncharacterized protein n=1 Tax=Armillaria ostoyae TaxID=47428 RepID=A0A284R8W7_ARMOS|nr:uncharacterized protein ARMOST_08527 [Armillaria ostoyae]
MIGDSFLFGTHVAAVLKGTSCTYTGPVSVMRFDE